MSDNYILTASPKRWASAHKPIRFVYDMPFNFGNLSDNNGFLQVDMLAALAGGKTIVVGDLIYINGGAYKGYHVVKSVVSNIEFTLETAFVATGSGLQIKYATPPQWEIWKGYQDSEVVGTNYFPYTKVADISPEGNTLGLIDFDVMGYVKSAMPTILEPTEGTSLGGGVYVEDDRSLYTPYRLLIGTNPESLYFELIYMALNSSIESDELNAEYLNTQKAMNTNAFINSCGATWLSFLGDNRVSTYRFENGGVLPSDGDFNNDFNNDFFNT